MSERARTAASSGPYDAGDPDAPPAEKLLDLGALRLSVPADAQPRITDDATSVHLQLPAGHLSLSVLTARRSTPLWPSTAEAIISAQGNEGAVSEPGEWGPQIQIGSPGELSWFIGADGPGWMVYGVASGPAERSADLVSALRELIRSSVVQRGSEWLPPRSALPLRIVDRATAAEQPGRHAGPTDRSGAPEGPGTSPGRHAGLGAAAGLGAVVSAGERGGSASDRPGDRESVDTGADSGATSREPMQPRTPPHSRPLPVTAAWHPSYHGAPSPDGGATDDPDDGPAPRPGASSGPTQAGAAPLRPLSGPAQPARPAQATGSDGPRHSGEWPAWLDDPFGPDPGSVGKHAAPRSRREPIEPILFPGPTEPAPQPPRPEHRRRTGLVAAASALVLLLGAASVLLLTHGTKPYHPSPTSAALPESEPSTALNTTNARPSSTMPGIPALTPPARPPSDVPPGGAPGGPTSGTAGNRAADGNPGPGNPGPDGNGTGAAGTGNSGAAGPDTGVGGTRTGRTATDNIGPGRTGSGGGATHRSPSAHRSGAASPGRRIAGGRQAHLPGSTAPSHTPRTGHGDQDDQGGRGDDHDDLTPDGWSRRTAHDEDAPVLPLDLLDQLGDTLHQLGGS